jgi:hypothetical protein
LLVQKKSNIMALRQFGSLPRLRHSSAVCPVFVTVWQFAPRLRQGSQYNKMSQQQQTEEDELFPYTQVIQWGHERYLVTLNQRRSWAFNVEDYVKPRLAHDDGEEERQWFVACWLHEQAEKTAQHWIEESEKGLDCLFEEGISVERIDDV